MADYDGQGLNFSAPSPRSDDDDSPKSMASRRVVKLEPVFRSLQQLSGGESGGRGSPSGRAGEMMMMVVANSNSSNKKPRGRPLGSKNRPRPPIVINKESESGMESVVIEISSGADVVESVVQYARRRLVGISLLSGCGSVSTVTLRHSLIHAPSSAMTLHGPFNLLSLSGSFMESLATSSSSFGICLAGSQGQVFGGIVGGPVIAASLVVVVAATFQKPRFYKLPVGPGHPHNNADESEDDDDDITQRDIKPSFLLGGRATTSNVAHETTTTSCGFGGGGSGSGSGSATIAAAMSTSTPMNPPQPMNCLHHDQLVQPWGTGAPPSRPPLPPHY